MATSASVVSSHGPPRDLLAVTTHLFLRKLARLAPAPVWAGPSTRRLVIGHMSLQDCKRRPPREVAPVQKARKQNSNKGVEGMHRGGRVRALTATTILVLAVATACTESVEPTAPPTPPATTAASTSPAPSTSPSSTPSGPLPTPTSDSGDAAARAVDVVHRYYAVLDTVGADPSAPLDHLEDVAISTVLSAYQHSFERWRRDGWVQHGATRLIEVNVNSVTLDNSEPERGIVPTVEIDVCYDVAAVNVVDANDEAVAQADLPDVGWERLRVANYSWDDDPQGSWRVASAETLVREPCQSS